MNRDHDERNSFSYTKEKRFIVENCQISNYVTDL